MADAGQGSANERGLTHEARAILSASGAFDRRSRIHDILDELERRARNGSETIGLYQQLTGTDYPGTLSAKLANGTIVIRGRAQHPPVGCTEHTMHSPGCAWCRAHAIEYARSGGSDHDEVQELRRRADDLDRDIDVVREAAMRLRPMLRRVLNETGENADTARAELEGAIDWLSRPSRWREGRHTP